jgi:redox-sensitive bicupin YhaK (pirin superfamily)
VIVMLAIRKAPERGRASFGWLDSRHSFSFGHYHDPAFMGHGPLRVINEDRVEPGRGFDTHGHRDMEIISYVLDGALEHKDSIGTGSVIRPGDVQRMSAGTGVMHSEFNASKTEPVHFLQIWILPAANGIAPGYEQKHFSDAEKRGRLRLVGSRDGREGSVTIHQDISLYAALLDGTDRVSYELPEGCKGWVQIARTEISLVEPSPVGR